MISLVSGGQESGRYMQEILSHAGLAWRLATPGDLGDDSPVIVITAPSPLDADARSRIEELVRNGAALVVTGGAAGLDDLLGVTGSGVNPEGFLTALDREHSVTAGLPAPLHVFGAAILSATSGSSLGKLLGSDNTTRLGDAVVINRPGRGATVAIAPDIATSVLHIQLGR